MKKPNAWATTHGVERRLDRLCELIGGWVRKSLRPLEERIAKLEARPQLRHVGVWKESKTYLPQNVVTHSGGLWVCKRKTKQRPRHGSWQLVVKSGGGAT